DAHRRLPDAAALQARAQAQRDGERARRRADPGQRHSRRSLRVGYILPWHTTHAQLERGRERARPQSAGERVALRRAVPPRPLPKLASAQIQPGTLPKSQCRGENILLLRRTSGPVLPAQLAAPAATAGRGLSAAGVAAAAALSGCGRTESTGALVCSTTAAPSLANSMPRAGSVLNMRLTASRWMAAGLPGLAVNLKRIRSAFSTMSATPCILNGARISSLN